MKRPWIVGIVFAAIIVGFLALFGRTRPSGGQIPYSAFKEQLAAGRIAEVTMTPKLVHGAYVPVEGRVERFRTIRVEDPELVSQLLAAKVEVQGASDPDGVSDLWFLLIPILVFMFLMRRSAQRGPFLATSGNRARVSKESAVTDTFADVAGADEAIDELREVVSFLRTPERFQRLGGRLPKGILLVGPPGTGKTLLARAVAGEASVPFFRISGSEFVELFVGVGAARVRDLFAEAKKSAPCIIFIDELDALGKVRGVGPMSHEEREQTLNQLLVELDGFDPREGVVLMAATNRPEILDPALLRAGRFDRHVLVDRPDREGRVAILRIHARKVKLDPAADLGRIAAITPGMAGADLANVINEAALLAVRKDRAAVLAEDLEEAVERVVAGLEKKNRVLGPKERERVAVHEVGHALVAMSIPGADAVGKISIIPRGIAALGYTLQLPAEDRRVLAKPELEARIAVLLGGRAAEQLVFGTVSTGGQDDIAKATHIARDMVKSFGMSEKLGPVRYEVEGQPLFIEVPRDGHGPFGEETARTIDAEVRELVRKEEHRALAILRSKEDELRAAAAQLLAKEVLTGAELAALTS